MEDMRKAFETNKMRVMIESVSYTGSAFGSNEDGDSVFFNQRLVEKVELEMGTLSRPMQSRTTRTSGTRHHGGRSGFLRRSI